MTALVTVRVIRNDFNRGLKYARKLGGVYDPTSKTYTLPANLPELGNLKAYGLELVTPAKEVGADHITDDRYLLAGDILTEEMDDEHSSL